MKTIKFVLSMAAIGAALLLQPGVAGAAEGVAARPSSIPESARASLLKEITSYRAAHPEAFAAVLNVKGHRPEVYSHFRKPEPEVSRELRRLGASALLPMLNELAFEAPPRGELSDQEWDALTVGLLDAVGVLRDARSGPVLRVIFEGSSARSASVQRAAAQAVGRLCGDADLASLLKRAVPGNAMELAAIAGLGECRRVESAKHLAGLLAGATGDDSLQVIVSALGLVSSSWAWKAMGPSAEAAGLEVREIAAKALVAGFVQHTGDIRDQIRRSLSLADHKGTLDFIAKARSSADAPTAAELDALSKRVQSASSK